MPARTPGRRSLNGAGDSPQLRVRLPAELLAALRARSADQGVTVSELARRILAEAADQVPLRSGDGHLDQPRLSGPLGVRLRERRREVVASAEAHGLSNVRVFGSVARGDDHPDSDVDLLVDIPRGVGLLGLARARVDLQHILGTRVDLVPSTDLKPEVAADVLAELVPL
jgi:predicted nucleotidyltransferase